MSLLPFASREKSHFQLAGSADHLKWLLVYKYLILLKIMRQQNDQYSVNMVRNSIKAHNNPIFGFPGQILELHSSYGKLPRFVLIQITLVFNELKNWQAD